MSTSKTEELIRAHRDAAEYVGKIGAPQYHFRDGSVGRLHSLKIETQIGHQASHGATNYWKDKAFDAALEKVVKRHFADLAAEALKLMEWDAHQSLINEEAALRERLDAIEALKRQQPNAAASIGTA